MDDGCGGLLLVVVVCFCVGFADFGGFGCLLLVLMAWWVLVGFCLVGFVVV